MLYYKDYITSQVKKSRSSADTIKKNINHKIKIIIRKIKEGAD